MSDLFQPGDWVLMKIREDGFVHGRVLDTWLVHGEQHLAVSCRRPPTTYGIPASMCEPYDAESLARPLRRLLAAISTAACMAQAEWQARHPRVASYTEERLVVQTDYGCPEYMRDMPTRWENHRIGFRTVGEAMAYRDDQTEREKSAAALGLYEPWNYRVVVERRSLEVL